MVNHFADISNIDQVLSICNAHYATSGHDDFYSECLGEVYYRFQIVERTKFGPNNPYGNIGATFPCTHGIVAIGTLTHESANDGHKFGCGFKQIQGQPIVYSFGSRQQQDFENGVLSLRPDSKIFVFEIDPAGFPDVRIPSVEYFNIGLGYADTPVTFSGVPIKSLHEIMIQLGHSYIDILKIDIEGCEFDFIQKEGKILRRVGQVLMEVHNFNLKLDTDYEWEPADKLINLIKGFESNGQRVFFKEINKIWNKACEFGFMQAEWSSWNKNKHQFKPFHPHQSIISRRLTRFKEPSGILSSTATISFLLMLAVVLFNICWLWRNLAGLFRKSAEVDPASADK